MCCGIFVLHTCPAYFKLLVLVTYSCKNSKIKIVQNSFVKQLKSIIYVLLYASDLIKQCKNINHYHYMENKRYEWNMNYGCQVQSFEF